MQPTSVFLAVALVVMISGCAGNDIILQKQKETDLRLAQLAEGYSDINAKVAKLNRELNDLQDQVKSNTATCEEIRPKIGKMREELDLIAAFKSSQSVPTPSKRIEVVSKEAVPADREKTVQDEYMKAYGLFSENNYSGAIEAFGSFIRKYPASEYAGNAQYWIGECHYTQQEFPEALAAFNRVLSSYPKGKKVPDAMLKIGFSYISMNDQAKAKVALQKLVDKYPNSQAALKARERLIHF